MLTALKRRVNAAAGYFTDDWSTSRAALFPNYLQISRISIIYFTQERWDDDWRRHYRQYYARSQQARQQVLTLVSGDVLILDDFATISRRCLAICRGDKRDSGYLILRLPPLLYLCRRCRR